MHGLISGDEFPSVPGFPDLPGFNAPDPSHDSSSHDAHGNNGNGDHAHGNSDDRDGNGDGAHGNGYGKRRRLDPPAEPAARPSPAEPEPTEPEPSRSQPATPGKPAKPEEPAAWSGRPACHERGKCGTHGSRHHRPDFTGRRRCGSGTHGTTRSDHRTVQIDRSSDRSAHRRRSAVTERPQNVRPSRTVERSSLGGSHNAHRPVPEARGAESRADDNQIVDRSYRGSHRAGGQHHLDHQTGAEQRGSRVGRHHVELPADSQDDHFNR